MSESLWKSSDPVRFFLIPDDFRFPSGPFNIRSLTGQSRLVDSSTITAYEKTQEQATEWMQKQLGNALDGVRGWLENFADRLTGADDDPLGSLREAIERTQHLASKVAAEQNRFQSPADVQTIRTLGKRLRDIADQLSNAVAIPPI